VTRKHDRSVLAWQILIGVVLLGGWQLAAARDRNVRLFLSDPAQIAARIVELVATGKIWVDIEVTLEEIAWGFGLGGAIGLVLGFLLGRSRKLSVILEPYILAFYGIPRIALAPIFIIALGIGIWSKVAIVFIQVFFLVFINTFAGVRDVNEELVFLARVMRASHRLILRRVILPSAAPFIMLGLKSAVPYSVIGAVVGEFMAASQGLGYYISYTGQQFDSAGAFAGIFFLLVYITVATWLVQQVERRLIRWKRGEGTGVAI
jgi:NitT/TauT family transport system permease protein